MKNFKYKNIINQFKKYFVLLTIFSLIFTSIFVFYFSKNKNNYQVIQFTMTPKDLTDLNFYTNLELDLNLFNIFFSSQNLGAFRKPSTADIISVSNSYSIILNNFKKRLKKNNIRIYQETQTGNSTSFTVGTNEINKDFLKKLNLIIDQVYYDYKEHVLYKIKNFRNIYINYIFEITENIPADLVTESKIKYKIKILSNIYDVKINEIKKYMEEQNLNSFIKITDNEDELITNFELINVERNSKDIYLFSIILFLMFKLFFLFVIVIFKNK